MTYQFGDKRLDMRAKECFNMIELHPNRDFPQIFSRPAELEAFYRLIHNPRLDFDSLIGPVRKDTLKNLKQIDTDFLVLHDTTEVQPLKAESIEAFKEDGKFFAHLSLLTTFSTPQQSLGVLDASLFTLNNYESEFIYKDFSANQHDCWWDHVVHVNSLLPDQGIRAIHVMDRAGDASKIWAQLCETKCRFVIRLFKNRKAQLREENGKLFDLIREAPVKAERTLLLKERKSSAAPRSKKRFPDRKTRQAHLKIAAEKLNIYKADRHYHSTKESLPVHIVRVFEQREKDPVEWILLTTEPIDTAEDILRIVDIYKSRWFIEDFFKGLKSGCRLEERQFTDETSWYRLFFFLLPIVNQILNIRTVLRGADQGSFSVPILTQSQMKILKYLGNQSGREVNTLRQSYQEIAHLGGHIKSNGPPGWKVLIRGYMDLLQLEKGWKMAQKTKDVISP